jgi:protocatechuate 3,4-dioxygenase alpha subunit
MAQRLDYLKQTASQTAGPYVHIGLAPHEAGFDIFETSFGNVLVGPGTRGERIAIEGTVIDGGGAVVKDALVEIWQANAFGRYNHPADRQDRNLDAYFRGWGRAAADFDTGLWRFETVKPGACLGRNGKMMAPHVSLWFVARGINIGLHTRLYFADEAQANAADPVLALIENPQRRTTLIAPRLQRGTETVYRFDIVLQGENETVFLDV